MLVRSFRSIYPTVYHNITESLLIAIKSSRKEDEWVPYATFQGNSYSKILFDKSRTRIPERSFSGVMSNVRTKVGNLPIVRGLGIYFENLLLNTHQGVNQVDSETVDAFLQRYEGAFLNAVDAGVEIPEVSQNLLVLARRVGVSDYMLTDTLGDLYISDRRYLIGRGMILAVSGDSIVPLVVIVTKPKYAEYFQNCMILEEAPIVESFISVENRNFNTLHGTMYKHYLQACKKHYGSIRAISREKMGGSELTKRFFDCLDVRSNFGSIRERKEWIDGEIEDFLEHSGNFLPNLEQLEGNVILTP